MTTTAAPVSVRAYGCVALPEASNVSSVDWTAWPAYVALTKLIPSSTATPAPSAPFRGKTTSMYGP